MVNNLQQITDTLNAFLAGDTSLPQAYLFIGDHYSARKIAQDFAVKILNLSKSGYDAKFPNVDSLQYDVAESGGIESIREMLQMAALMPVQSDYKVVLMENMHLANVQMMNALLKTLEEPPKYTIFLLLSKQPLLPTVMSRCQVFSLSGLSDVEISEDVSSAVGLLKKNRTLGTAERMALVSELAGLEDETLIQALEQWMYSQKSELKNNPQKYPALRNTMETIQSLRGNFNKKMVLQNFVLTGLV